MLPMAMAWSSSGIVAIHYVLPVLWMTSYFFHVTICLMKFAIGKENVAIRLRNMNIIIIVNPNR